MRISDWSSDVCSSDLRLLRHLAELRARRGQPQAMRAAVEQRRADPAFERAHAAAEGGPGHVPPLRGTERESVGEGKSVAVRVDIGGRRIIKKKTNKDRERKHLTRTNKERHNNT